MLENETNHKVTLSKMAVTFEPLMRFQCPSKFKISEYCAKKIPFMVGSTIFIR